MQQFYGSLNNVWKLLGCGHDHGITECEQKRMFKLTHMSSMHGASLPMNGEKEFLCVMMKVVKQAAACIEMNRRQATELISRIIYK